MPFLSLAFNAVDSRRSKHRTGPPSWAFTHYPWLWAPGIFSTPARSVAVVWALVVPSRRSNAATA
jgi:hypothetical protein